jgi:hypothetical protein
MKYEERLSEGGERIRRGKEDNKKEKERMTEKKE